MVESLSESIITPLLVSSKIMLTEIQIDPRNEFELMEQATQHAYSVSGGALNNFTPGDPLTALIEGQVYAGAELLWYVNKLPAKLASYWLSNWGFATNVGTVATGDLTIYLTGILPTDTTVGVLTVTNGNTMFQTTGPITITAGQTSGLVGLVCTEVGTQGNAPAYSVTRIVTRTPFVRSVANESALTGGTDPITDEDVVDLAIARVQSAQLISITDYESEVLRFLGRGLGWVVRVIPGLGLEGRSDQYGHIGVLLANPRLEQISVGTIESLTQQLRLLAPLSINPWVSRMVRVPVQFKIWAKHPDTANQEETANLIRLELLELIGSGGPITQNDLVVAASRSGAVLTVGTINNQSDWQPASKVEFGHPDYIEVNLISYSESTNGKNRRSPIDSGRLFVWGTGDTE